MIDNGDVAFMIITTVLVFFMTPGLAFFYGGLVERKNSLTMMIYTFIAIGIVTILWVLGGFSLVFGDSLGGIIGNPTQYIFMKDVDFKVNPQYGPKIPFLMFFMYQLMFAIITAPLMSGAFANRLSVLGWIKIIIFWMIFVYFPVAHWIWGGGFLGKWGFVDYAGGTVIHVSAAFGALSSLFFLGRRSVLFKKPCGNPNLMLIGASILMFGWFGFNSGGALSGGMTASIAFTNTGIAAAFAMITWVIFDYCKTKKFSVVALSTGAVAGLATITPASGYITPQSAVIIGVMSAFVCYSFLNFAIKRNWDDALGVWGVHGMGGFTGTIMIGIFAQSEVNPITGSLHQFLIQLAGASIVAAYSFIITYLIFKFSDTIGSIKVSPEIQEKGLDSEYMIESDLPE